MWSMLFLVAVLVASAPPTFAQWRKDPAASFKAMLVFYRNPVRAIKQVWAEGSEVRDKAKALKAETKLLKADNVRRRAELEALQAENARRLAEVEALEAANAAAREAHRQRSIVYDVVIARFQNGDFRTFSVADDIAAAADVPVMVALDVCADLVAEFPMLQDR